MDFIREQCAPDGPARRLDELHARARSADQDAADRRWLAEVVGIELAELDAFKADALAQLTGGETIWTS